jgi:hypothetical protein
VSPAGFSSSSARPGWEPDVENRKQIPVWDWSTVFPRQNVGNGLTSYWDPLYTAAARPPYSLMLLSDIATPCGPPRQRLRYLRAISSIKGSFG